MVVEVATGGGDDVGGMGTGPERAFVIYSFGERDLTSGTTHIAVAYNSYRRDLPFLKGRPRGNRKRRISNAAAPGILTSCSPLTSISRRTDATTTAKSVRPVRRP